MKTKQLNVALDFSPEPAGRYPEDGPFNGQRFREELLVPALVDNDEVCVNFDGTEGYGSSFLNEAFGGITRLELLSEHTLREKLRIVSEEDPSVIDEIWQYIGEAAGMSQLRRSGK
ncbi:hypothetical protein AEM42_10195 [Betaproteobacteria bacterium UKL13-2]|nr:hypothetical protein AEM42_10195 [Betaproteobacteria bacterium UKL13-2]HCG52517.1 DUF4325 domain-containing protein [Betaproteobacteria bacterium]